MHSKATLVLSDIYTGGIGLKQYITAATMFQTASVMVGDASLGSPDVFSLSGTAARGFSFMIEDAGHLVPAGPDLFDGSWPDLRYSLKCRSHCSDGSRRKCHARG